MAAIGFDVYGTLVDPLAISAALEPVVGERATEMAGIWRTKQLEYSFRRALMRSYENFDVCTREALHYAARAVDLRLTDDDVAGLLEAYLDLDPYPDVVPGIESLQTQGHALVAFSNGVETSLRELLSRAGVLDHLDGVVSVDPVQTFKPNPVVYRHLARQLESPRQDSWLVSSNYWDVIGARQAGLHAAWLRRDPAMIPDPWGIEPDIVIATISELADYFA